MTTSKADRMAFGRWDLSHLHSFSDDDRMFVPGGNDFMDDVGDGERTRVASLGLTAGSTLEYVFDLGDSWTHACTVEEVDIDPRSEWGEPPPGPVPIWG